MKDYFIQQGGLFFARLSLVSSILTGLFFYYVLNQTLLTSIAIGFALFLIAFIAIISYAWKLSREGE